MSRKTKAAAGTDGGAGAPTPVAETVRDRLLATESGVSNAELKVIRALLANYPAAGLTTVSKLAREAGVSDPTVIRLATRLGFEGFADLQATLVAEVELHMRSPLTLRMAPTLPGQDNVFHAFFQETQLRCGEMATSIPTLDYERCVALLADQRLRVLCLGGRFSRFIAGVLQRCLHHLRPGCEFMDGSDADISDRIADVDRRHLLVVFDYRRYQTDTVRFARQAKDRGASVILFTDIWRSPIAEFADIVLTAPIETASPFDTLVTPLLQVEAVIAGLASLKADDWRPRVMRIEAVRSENNITLGANKTHPWPKEGKP